MSEEIVDEAYARALWRIYNRREIPELWKDGGNLPWDEPEFSERILREHLDESHGAASRNTSDRLKAIDRMWAWLDLKEGARLLDVTCGPGLYAVEFARRGCQVTGYDFSPASIAYARDLARKLEVEDRCRFIQQDVRTMELEAAAFDAAIFIYGQLSVFPTEQTRALLGEIGRSLAPGGRLCVELLNPDRLDKKNSSWWFTDDTGLWGDRPFMHLGERFWLEEQQMSVERFLTLDLETGALDTVTLCDQSYKPETVVELMQEAGFTSVEIYPAWDGVTLYDNGEWIVYVARK